MRETSFLATQYRRTVVLDVETVSIDPSTRGALDALTGRIVCICLLIDDGATLSEIAIANEDERRVLTEFWSALDPHDVLVGHNVLEFDIPFIRQRSWILGIRPSRVLDLRKYYTPDVQDTMQIWTNWGFRKGVSLDALGSALGCGNKTGNGMDVATWWAMRDLRAIKDYCMEDVRLTYRVYCRLKYAEPCTRKPNQDRIVWSLQKHRQGQRNA
jgi:predicted PolB exonuclease-like 3'-5' exonuclease